jgi:ectoine hydroxylase-related dioxygenase (phytanoyl-CoA dioxygenase family)
MMKEKGYLVENFLREFEHDILLSELELFVTKQCESLNIKIDNLTQYHKYVDDDIHYKIIKKIYDNSFFDEINFNVEIIENRISDILDRKLVIKDDYYQDTKKINIRAIRPNKNDMSPIHRDTWLDKLKESGINLYIPLWGSNKDSSLAVAEGSHKWVNLVKVNDDKFSVPKLKVPYGFPLIRPNPKPNEVLIFYPKLIHSGLNNTSNETRFSLEIRLYEN